ncbi:hypothetical protein BCR43DRAFT_483842 [Syncephalastrum racemosum]|uniref:Uncharacterized protein n=1 Tax=Syncephalastrum racemosum TaxID=13706 RepID=A0A1X2HVT4_SYNRA|nr:hypothetical protein BCR43DRAFT_483842 [Syncephalastrum racemosum]
MRFYSLLILSFAAAVVMACPEREEDPTEVYTHDCVRYTKEQCRESCPRGYARFGKDTCEEEEGGCHAFKCCREVRKEA